MTRIELDPWEVAGSVIDPELPMLTLADLGVLRAVTVDDTGGVAVEIRPTWSGCPAMDVMKAELVRALTSAGWARVEVKVALTPPWSSDDISDEGRRKLLAAGVTVAERRRAPVHLSRREDVPACPNCGSPRTARTSGFGATACTSLHRCLDCREPFEHVKAI